MSQAQKRMVAVVTACMKKNGTPALVLNEVSITTEEAENGIHYYLAEANLLEEGFEEPFVHFDEDEAPAFLHAAVRQHSPSPSNTNPSEELACRASSS